MKSYESLIQSGHAVFALNVHVTSANNSGSVREVQTGVTVKHVGRSRFEKVKLNVLPGPSGSGVQEG